MWHTTVAATTLTASLFHMILVKRHSPFLPANRGRSLHQCAGVPQLPGNLTTTNIILSIGTSSHVIFVGHRHGIARLFHNSIP